MRGPSHMSQLRPPHLLQGCGRHAGWQEGLTQERHGGGQAQAWCSAGKGGGGVRGGLRGGRDHTRGEMSQTSRLAPGTCALAPTAAADRTELCGRTHTHPPGAWQCAALTKIHGCVAYLCAPPLLCPGLWPHSLVLLLVRGL
jgi:hypothetical protein